MRGTARLAVRAGMICWCTIAAFTLTAQSLRAQTCFRGQPPPACKGFLLIEPGYSFGLNPDVNRHYVTWDLGYMHNVGRSAVGGTGFVGTDFEATRLGLKGRYRYWLNQDHGLELSAGVLVAGSGAEFPGFAGDVAWNYRDMIGVVGRVEVLDLHQTYLTSEKDVLGYLGIKFGSKPGVIGIAAEAAAALVIGIGVAIACADGECW